MKIYIPPYNPIAIKKLIDDGFQYGVYDQDSSAFSDDALIGLYDHICNNLEANLGVVYRYHEYYTEEVTKNLLN